MRNIVVTSIAGPHRIMWCPKRLFVKGRGRHVIWKRNQADNCIWGRHFQPARIISHHLLSFCLLNSDIWCPSERLMYAKMLQRQTLIVKLLVGLVTELWLMSDHGVICATHFISFIATPMVYNNPAPIFSKGLVYIYIYMGWEVSSLFRCLFSLSLQFSFSCYASFFFVFPWSRASSRNCQKVGISLIQPVQDLPRSEHGNFALHWILFSLMQES